MSIDDVARLAGVSTATVSRTLSGRGPVSDAARLKVTAAAESLGYIVSASASNLASGRTRNIGVLVPFLDSWFFTTVLSGIASVLRREGYDLTLYGLTADRRERAEVFDSFRRRRQVDGLLSIAIELDDDEAVHLAELGLPVVAIGSPHPRLATMSLDDVVVARLATEHLLSLGHREIAHIGASEQLTVAVERRRGFEEALTAAGVRPDPAFFEPGDFTMESGHRAATRLLDAASPTAIFAASDEMAIGAMLAVQERGLRVPEDVSIIGVDGHELGEFFGMTTVDQFPRDQGERAATALLAEVEGPGGSPRTSALPYELVVRRTTAARAHQ